MNMIRLKIHFIFLILFISILLLSFNTLFSQNLKARKISEKIKIDGRLSERVWSEADFITDFTQFEPEYGKPASLKTSVKVLYNDKMIYFGFICRDPEIEKIAARVTKRDGNLDIDDTIVLMIDTFNDDNNSYMFFVNSMGTQKDVRVSDNGRTNDSKWDASWKSESFIYEDGWSVEIGIPFEVLRYNANINIWGFNALRIIPRNLEKSCLIKNIVSPYKVSQFGNLTNLKLKSVIGKKYTIIPYSQLKLQLDEKGKIEYGGDIRYSISSNISLQAAVNPDFATVEADVEQINLTRFELRYPEKRPFFQEGAENYQTRVRQFYSRRIGEIPWGAKITGKIGKWKINGLSTQSDPSTAGTDVEPGKEAFYNVFKMGREFKKGSNISIIGANRTYSNKNTGSIGLSATLFFTDVLGMTSQIIKSHGTKNKGTWVYFFRPAYDSKDFHFHVRYSHFGENIMENMNSIGFIRDDDRKEFDTNIRKIIWLNKHGIEQITPSINYNRYYSQSGVLRSWEIDNNFEMEFLKKWALEISYVEEFKRYEKDFRNKEKGIDLEYDSKKGTTVSMEYVQGINYDRDFEEITGGLDLKLFEGWNLDYRFTKIWFKPDTEDETSFLHFIRTTYYVNKDLFLKLFYQSRYRFSRSFFDPKFDLSKEVIQFVFVWRIMPPFGSIQLAYQKGKSKITEIDKDEETLFTKVSWVF